MSLRRLRSRRLGLRLLRPCRLSLRRLRSCRLGLRLLGSCWLSLRRLRSCRLGLRLSWPRWLDLRRLWSCRLGLRLLLLLRSRRLVLGLPLSSAVGVLSLKLSERSNEMQT